MWELCTFSKGMRILFRGDFCIILFEVLNDLFTLSDITDGKVFQQLFTDVIGIEVRGDVFILQESCGNQINACGNSG